MAICPTCRGEMLVARTCNGEPILIDGRPFDPIRFGKETDPWRRSAATRRCHDCGITRGGFHHPGCDMEECPDCGDQLLMCGCLDDPEEKALRVYWPSRG